LSVCRGNSHRWHFILQILAGSKFLWEKILREAPHIQTKIAPMMRAHSSKIKSDIIAYEAHLKEYKAALGKAEFYLYATGTRRATELLDAAEATLLKERAVCDKMAHIANVFECIKEMDTSLRLMGEVSDLINDFKMLWEVFQRVVLVMEEARKISWANLDPEVSFFSSFSYYLAWNSLILLVWLQYLAVSTHLFCSF